MQTELGTRDHTTLRPPNTLFPLFPSTTVLTSMVAVLQTDKRTRRVSILFSRKIMFPDSSEIVIAVPSRLLWAGADGVAYGVDPRSVWRIAAARTERVIVSAGVLPRANG
jgi:hypothetical protein